jgi:hypothetical protein
LCPAAPLDDPKRAGTAGVSERGREGISHRFADGRGRSVIDYAA